MSIKDPRPKLRSILRLCEEGHLPAKAKYWATSALKTAEGIYDSIDEMEERGVDDVPTSRQEQALANIYRGACGWLRIDPEEAD